jgi:diadenosine tetraphosphate (Ap4A) HIT family hydrolase
MDQTLGIDLNCKICSAVGDDSTTQDTWLYRDDVWVVRAAKQSALPAWLQLVTRRHAHDLSQFNDVEAASLGPALRTVQRALIQASGALRVYTASLCEGTTHFHAHLVPRLPDMPQRALGFKAFDLLDRMRKGTVDAADPETAAKVQAEVKRLLSAENLANG